MRDRVEPGWVTWLYDEDPEDPSVDRPVTTLPDLSTWRELRMTTAVIAAVLLLAASCPALPPDRPDDLLAVSEQQGQAQRPLNTPPETP